MTAPPIWLILIIFAATLAGFPARATECFRPEMPLQPYPDDDPETRSIIREDFLRYFNEMQEYFRCLDLARINAINEGNEVNKKWRETFQKKTKINVTDMALVIADPEAVLDHAPEIDPPRRLVTLRSKLRSVVSECRYFEFGFCSSNAHRDRRKSP